MKRVCLASLIAIILAAPHSVYAKALLLNESYLQASGVIMTYPDDKNFIDPYFSTKALLTAHDNGMDVRVLAKGWIEWLLPRQEKDGLFSRFCRDEDTQNYQACVIADADDSMLSMWVELLYRMAPKSGMPAHWEQSARKAELQLDSLYNKEWGVYVISEALPVGLLMDNIEVYAALKNASKEAKRIGESQQATLFSLKAARLKSGIIKTFWNQETKTFRVSTQARDEKVFYPDVVAQLMPMLQGFHFSAGGTPNKIYNEWMQNHHQEWVDLLGKDYPWGLVAVVAAQRNDMKTAQCWLQQASASRLSGPWSVLDEAAYQSVEWNVQKQPRIAAADCQKVFS